MQIFCIESHQYWKERYGESRPSFGETRSGKKHNIESRSEAIRDDKFEAEKIYLLRACKHSQVRTFRTLEITPQVCFDKIKPKYPGLYDTLKMKENNDRPEHQLGVELLGPDDRCLIP